MKDVNNNPALDNINKINTFTRGKKFFELSNHLGNVLVTVSDKKIQHSTNGTTVDYYNAIAGIAYDTRSASYSPIAPEYLNLTDEIPTPHLY